MTLRQLRLWHYKKAVHFNRLSESYHEEFIRTEARYCRNMAKNNKTKADWHMNAVKACDEHFSPADSVTLDYAKETGGG